MAVRHRGETANIYAVSIKKTFHQMSHWEYMLSPMHFPSLRIDDVVFQRYFASYQAKYRWKTMRGAIQYDNCVLRLSSTMIICECAGDYPMITQLDQPHHSTIALLALIISDAA